MRASLGADCRARDAVRALSAMSRAVAALVRAEPLLLTTLFCTSAASLSAASMLNSVPDTCPAITCGRETHCRRTIGAKRAQPVQALELRPATT